MNVPSSRRNVSIRDRAIPAAAAKNLQLGFNGSFKIIYIIVGGRRFDLLHRIFWFEYISKKKGGKSLTLPQSGVKLVFWPKDLMKNLPTKTKPKLLISRKKGCYINCRKSSLVLFYI